MLVIENATFPDGDRCDLRVDRERGTIDAVGPSLSGTSTLDATGLRVFPGMIDVHVHFREPGFEYKETWETGSRSAAAGGVTTVVDQPNTDPPTINGAAFDQKLELATDSLVDFGINGGVTSDWSGEELLSRTLFALGEIFLADSTGDMGIDESLFEEAIRLAAAAQTIVTVHAEDATRFDETVRGRSDPDAWSAYRTVEAEVTAIERACEVGVTSDAQLHLAHVTTPEGIDTASEKGATTEVCPHHILLSRDDLDELGTYGRVNPPLRSERRRQAVYERVADGSVDMIATDHAPHTRGEKDVGIWEAPSGVPGVETALPLLFEEARQGRLGYERIRDLTAANPARHFDLPTKGRLESGADADVILVDPEAARPIVGAELHSKCDWTPFEGWNGVFPKLTLVRGEIAYVAPDVPLPEKMEIEGQFGESTGQSVRE